MSDVVVCTSIGYGGCRVTHPQADERSTTLYAKDRRVGHTRVVNWFHSGHWVDGFKIQTSHCIPLIRVSGRVYTSSCGSLFNWSLFSLLIVPLTFLLLHATLPPSAEPYFSIHRQRQNNFKKSFSSLSSTSLPSLFSTAFHTLATTICTGKYIYRNPRIDTMSFMFYLPAFLIWIVVMEQNCSWCGIHCLKVTQMRCTAVFVSWW